MTIRTTRALLASCALVLCAAHVSTAAAAERCEDLFRSLGNDLAKRGAFETDFGTGAYVTKVSATEFRIEPPPIVVDSARKTQTKLVQLARNNGDARFTVLFSNVSLAEALTFKTMLQREAQLEGDDRLTAVLLPKGDGEVMDYESSRESSLAVRELMLRRYDWTSATVVKEADSAKTNQESYRMTVSGKEKPEEFLLRLQVRSRAFFSNRVAAIKKIFTRNDMSKANPEQAAHVLVKELKKTDKGISGGSLKVMAGDFEIARLELTPYR